MCLLFCGILAPGNSLGFWVWMFRISPFTYIVSAMLSTGISGTSVTCAAEELSTVQPPLGQTCAEYLNSYIKTAGSELLNGDSTKDCQVCPTSSTDQFLASLGINPADAWYVLTKFIHLSKLKTSYRRNFGLIWIFVAANIAGAFLLYWLARVPKGGKAKEVQNDAADATNHAASTGTREKPPSSP